MHANNEHVSKGDAVHAGALGTNDNVNYNIPTQVYGGLLFRQITSTAFTTCAVAIDNTGYCWGGGGYGCLGEAHILANLIRSIGLAIVGISRIKPMLCREWIHGGYERTQPGIGWTPFCQDLPWQCICPGPRPLKIRTPIPRPAITFFNLSHGGCHRPIQILSFGR